MELKKLLETRRSTRSLAPVEVTEDLIHDLAHCAKLAPSCSNNQPWRFVFAYDPGVLKRLFATMAEGNEWTHEASMLVAVFSARDFDHYDEKREYYLYDTGMATAFLLLRAADLGLVAHPIAGFDDDKAKDILGIPREMTLIALINIGKKADQVNPVLSDMMALGEKQRPPRKEFHEFAYINKYKP
ncbi:MAG: nitroreductase [bacterium]|nr:nitroreductase [bacterium]